MRNDLIVLVLATLVSYPLGLALRQPWLLPVLNALPAYIVLVHRLRKGERGGAVRGMLWWAATLAIAGTVIFVVVARAARPTWWCTGSRTRGRCSAGSGAGSGAEGNLRLFLPEHLVHLGAVSSWSAWRRSASARCCWARR